MSCFLQTNHSDIVAIHVVGHARSGTTLLVELIRTATDDVECICSEHAFPRFRRAIRHRYSDLGQSKTLQEFLHFVSLAMQGGVVRVLGAPRHAWAKIRPNYGELAAQLYDALTNEEAHRSRDHLEIFYRFARDATRASNRRYFVDKARPMDCSALYALQGEKRFVAIVRDPRAVLASESTRWVGRSVLLDAYRLKLWWRRTLKFCRQRPESTLLIRYEDLICAPDETVAELERFLGMTPGALHPSRVRSNSSYDDNQTSEDGLRKVSLSRWKSVLSEPQVAIIERIFERQMTAFGYHTLGSSRRLALRDDCALLYEALTAGAGHAQKWVRRTWSHRAK